MAVTPEQAADAWLSRVRREHQAVAERSRALVARAAEAAQVLKRSLGAHRVLLFGSLAWGEPHAGSDVDMAVEGLDGDRLVEAAMLAESIVEAPVDLHALEQMPPALSRRVLAEGIPL